LFSDIPIYQSPDSLEGVILSYIARLVGPGIHLVESVKVRGIRGHQVGKSLYKLTRLWEYVEIGDDVENIQL
jgi:hypothetical protein